MIKLNLIKKMKKCLECKNFKYLNDFYLITKNTKRCCARCKDCTHNRSSLYYQKNKKKIIEKVKIYALNNRQFVLGNHRAYYKKNKEEISIKKKKYRLEHKKERNEYEKNKKETDALYRLKCSLRNRLGQAIKYNFKSGSAVRDLGCSIEDLKIYLEKQFYSHPKTGEPMTWENWALDGWHIDHICPLSKVDLTDREQLLKVCHYTNLQPLWFEENLLKGNKI